jgi:broad specificity phosphatase PhoE
METTIIFVKGGENQFSVEGLWQGQSKKTNIGLTPNGFASARQLADSLKDTPIDKSYSSPLLRASQTADEVMKYHGLSIETSQLLNQRKIKPFEKKKSEDVIRKYQNTTGINEKPNADEIFETRWKEGIETNKELSDRMNSFVQMVEEKHSGKRIFAATHTDNIRMIVRKALNEPVSVDYKIQNHAILILEIREGKWSINPNSTGIDKRNNML